MNVFFFELFLFSLWGFPVLQIFPVTQNDFSLKTNIDQFETATKSICDKIC